MGNTVRNIVMNTQTMFEDIADGIQIWHKRKQEINKFNDKRRRAIYETVQLTEKQKKAIDDLYTENYGEKIPYIWHRHYTAFTGHFDVNYFPELLFIPEFERYCNLYQSFVSVLCDKNFQPFVAKAAGIKMPEVLLSSTRGFIKDAENQPVSYGKALDWFSNAGEVFVKPSINTGSGTGCALLQMENGKDTTSGKTAEGIFDTLGKDFSIQKRLICSEDVRTLHPNSCNTFRVITYRWKNTVRIMPVIMRIGRNNNTVDNAHAGGIFVGVNNDGTLKKTAFTEFNDQFTTHPDSGIEFENYTITGFQKVIDAARKMHWMVPQLGVVNWDFTIDDTNTPVLIEANTRGGGIWVIEMAHGTGPFGENTEEVLRWMREMKKRKASQREEIAFGNF